ncbi:hypothetical protein IMY05_004G0163200 [Salix suchowensis]|nr:hypothetical protein IMY05_004G0163200 [Salix suchowensis]
MCSSLQAWLEEKTNVALSLFTSFLQVNLYPPSRNQTVHQPWWLSGRIKQCTVRGERSRVSNSISHLYFFSF